MRAKTINPKEFLEKNKNLNDLPVELATLPRS